MAESLNIRSSPSAFQIRYGGCKGVVSVCPDLEADQIHVRKSMEKFKSDHYELEVVTYTKPGNLWQPCSIHLLIDASSVFTECVSRVMFSMSRNCVAGCLIIFSGVTSHRQPRQCRGAQGPITVKGAQSDRNY